MHRSRPRAVVAVVAVVAVAALAAGACSQHRGPLRSLSERSASSNQASAATTATTSPASSAPFVPQPIDWTGCGGREKCATLTVPLDYANPTGPTIKLSLAELPARHPEERIGPLLVNPGGPGGSGLSFVSGIPLPSEVLDRFDVIGWDPRGVGESTPVKCDDSAVHAFRELDSAPDSADEQNELDAAAKNIAQSCLVGSGDLLAHVGTDDVVRDMDTIRQALGEQQISYYGASYGTLLGLRYLALFPQHARAVVLDGVVDPTQDFVAFLRQQTIGFEASINKVFDACDTGPGCPPGGARAAYDRLASEVETSSIPTQVGDALGPGELPVAALLPSYDPSAAPVFYRGLTDALAGDGTTLESLFQDYERSADYGLYAAVECTDSPHPEGSDAYRAFAQELAGLSSRFGAPIANELLPCAFWPVPVHDVTGPVAAPDGPPVLVVGNTGDAATPYQQAVDVAKTLVHGRLLTFDSPGHTALGRSECIASAEAAYLVSLTLPDDGTVCTG